MPRKNRAVSSDAAHATALARAADATLPKRFHGARLSLTVAKRQPTLEEKRRFHAALDLLLTELIHQQLGRDGG